jgi:hypothetical protein
LSLEELATPDLDQIKQGKQGVRDRRGRFAGGRSGNPAGRPRGCREAGLGRDPTHIARRGRDGAAICSTLARAPEGQIRARRLFGGCRLRRLRFYPTGSIDAKAITMFQVAW